MTDGMSVVAELMRRMGALERRVYSLTLTNTRRPASDLPRIDPESAALLRYLNSGRGATKQEDQDSAAIIRWLETNTKTGRARTRPASDTRKGINS